MYPFESTALAGYNGVDRRLLERSVRLGSQANSRCSLGLETGLDGFGFETRYVGSDGKCYDGLKP